MPAHTMLLKIRPSDNGNGWDVLAPAGGFYSSAPSEGTPLHAGASAGCILILERKVSLVVPEGIGGFVATAPPALKRHAVNYGDTLFQLTAANDGDFTVPSTSNDAESTEGLVVRSPQAGRFYRRPEPDAPLYATDGDVLKAGRTLGLLEVMKTFNPVKYQPGHGLPDTATVLRFLVDDATDVEDGQALLVIES